MNCRNYKNPTNCVLELCNPINCSPPGSAVHGVSQASILEWVAISYTGDLPELGIEPGSPALAGSFFTTEPPRKPKPRSLKDLSSPLSQDIFPFFPPSSLVPG